MKNKIVTLILVGMLAVSTAACGGPKDDKSSDTQKESTVDDAGEETTPTEEKTDDPEETEPEDAPEPAAEVIEPYETDLAAGTYVVGLHIPEGVYNVQVNSGLGTMMTSTGTVSAMGTGTAVEYATTFDNLTLKVGDTLELSQSLNVKITTQEANLTKMTGYDNPATEEKELSPGNYVVGQDISAGVYDLSIVSGTANITLDDYSFTAMLSDNATLAESTGTTYKNLELEEGRTVQVTSGTVKLTPTADIAAPTP